MARVVDGREYAGMTKSGSVKVQTFAEGIVESLEEAVEMAEKLGKLYDENMIVALFKACKAGAAFTVTAEGLDGLDWNAAMTAVRDNDEAFGASIMFQDGGIHVRMLGMPE